MTRILLLVELKGGNDGLNTVIPYADPQLSRAAAGLGVARERTLQLDEHVGLHEKLEPLMESWKAATSRSCRASAIPTPTARISARSRSGTPPRRPARR